MITTLKRFDMKQTTVQCLEEFMNNGKQKMITNDGLTKPLNQNRMNNFKNINN